MHVCVCVYMYIFLEYYINKIYEQMFLPMLQFFNIDRFDFGSDVRKWNEVKKKRRIHCCALMGGFICNKSFTM